MKNIALLEYDSEQGAVVAPDHERLNIDLPAIAVFAFCGEAVDEFAKAQGAPVVAEFLSITKKYPIYVLAVNGCKICLCQAPCGAAPATQILDWLIAYGVKKVIATGSCGVLCDLPENFFLLPYKALRDEGTSFHYLPADRYIHLDAEMVSAIEGYFNSHDIPYKKCITWTTDGFFRETKKKVLSRKEEGCDAVEMECAALAACAEFRGIAFGQFFFTADSLHAIDRYDERDWGAASLRPALHLALDIAATLSSADA